MLKKYNYMKLYTTVIMFFISCSMFAQSQKECAGVEYAQQINSNEIKNTISAQRVEVKQEVKTNFQFILKNDIKPLITDDILFFVEENRSEDTDLIIDYSEKITLFIPSIKSLQSSSFEDLPVYK